MSSLKYRCILMCEDIRQEVGGRISLMGILSSKLLVQDFPLVFPKFCLFLEWGEFTGRAKVNLTIVPPAGVNMPNFRPTTEIPGQPGVVARSMIVLNNFPFPIAGGYTFEFRNGEELIGSETLVVEKMETPSGLTN
ncbi:MAG: hypothetical protein HQM09_11670 [Candidatus Riflebacteria bacterium]|nr:hypothetical protein [Candidatus Riflebacteria bacterium]